MAKRTDVSACLNIACRSQNHILKVDAPIKPPLVFLKNRFKDRKKRLGARGKLHPNGLGFAIRYTISAAFEFSKESREELGKAINLSQLDDAIKNRFKWSGLQGNVR